MDYGEVNEQEISDCLAFIMQHSPLEEQIKVVKTKLEQAKTFEEMLKVIMEQTTKLIELLKKSRQRSQSFKGGLYFGRREKNTNFRCGGI